MLTKGLAVLLSLCLFALPPRPSLADSLSFNAEFSSGLEELYARAAKGDLNLAPLYEDANIQVSDRLCDPTASEGAESACAPTPCPAAADLNLDITCLYSPLQGVSSSDLRIEGPYPVRRLGDYNPEWNAYQFEVLRTKFGGGLPLFGLLRTLYVPEHEKSGFFEYKSLDETSDGKVQVAAWRAAADKDGSPSCTPSLCFSVFRAAPAPDVQWKVLKEALLECVSWRTNGSTGAPEYCAPIYFDGQYGEMALTLTSFKQQSMKVSRGLIGANVFFETFQGRNPDFAKVAALVEKAFTDPPLEFATDRDPDAVVGTSDMRVSTVLANWRELATVRAVMSDPPFTYQEPGGNSETLVGIQIGLAITLFVNNRNTTDESDWRMPTPAQSASYQNAVIAAIRSEAVNECGPVNARVRSSVTILSCPVDKW